MRLVVLVLAVAACSHRQSVATQPVSSPPAVVQLASFTRDTGYAPRASLVIGPGGALYGTTWKGGNFFECGTPTAPKQCSCGTVYRVDGLAITVVHAFAALDATGRNPYGCGPVAPVSFNGSGRLYVVSRAGGTGGNPLRAAPGAIASMLPDGQDVEVEHAFTGGADGSLPAGALVWSGDSAYGTTPQGVYRFTAGSLAMLVGFRPLSTTRTNDGGSNAYGSPTIASDGSLIGWATYGGANAAGAVFHIDPTTKALTSLYDFPAYAFTGNTDNAPLQSPIVASDGSAWLTSEFGGTNGTGMVIKVERTATVVHEGGPWISTATPTTPRFSSMDGALPLGTLVELGGWMYGTTYYGGANGVGSIFRIGLDGRGYQMLYSFGPVATNSLSYPASGLTIGADGALYGTTYLGGDIGGGAIYRLEVP